MDSSRGHAFRRREGKASSCRTLQEFLQTNQIADQTLRHVRVNSSDVTMNKSLGVEIMSLLGYIKAAATTLGIRVTNRRSDTFKDRQGA